jgi:hypothetical protein
MAKPVFSWNAKTTEEKAKASSYSTTLPKAKRTEPTAVGSVLRDLARAPATIAVRPGQMLAALKGFTPEEQTVKSKYLGDIKAPTSKKDVIKDVGRALETVSYGVGAGGLAKNSLTKIAGMEALAGALGSGGRSVSEGNNVKKVLKDTAVGGAIGVVAGVGFAKLAPMFSWSKKAANVVEEAPVSANTTVESAIPTPTVARGTKPNPLNAEKVNYEPYTPDSELPVIEMGSKPKSDMPTIQTQPKQAKAPGDFTYQPIVDNPKQVILKRLNPDGTPMEAPKMEKTVSNDVATQGSKNTDFTQSPTIDSKDPFSKIGSNPQVDKEIVDKTASSLETVSQTKSKSSIPKVDSINLKEESQKAMDWVNSVSPEKARKVALGIDNAPDGIRSEAIHGVLSNKAWADGNGSLLTELAASDVYKLDAQGVTLGRIKDPENPYYILKELNTHFEKNNDIIAKINKGPSVKKFTSDIKNAVENAGLSTEHISAAINRIICK